MGVIPSTVQTAEAPAESSRRLLHIMPSFGVGGIQVRFARVANALGGKYRHVVVALDGVQTCRERLEANVAVHFPGDQFEKTQTLGNMRRYSRFLREQRPDLLLTYNWGTIEWAMANRLCGACRHVHFEDGFGPEEALQQFRRRILFRRVALARASKVVVPSRVLEGIAHRVWRLRRDQVAYVPNGIDIARFARFGAGADRYGVNKRPGDLIIGTVAPLRAEKNIGRLLRVFARLGDRPALRLVIAGDGAERKALETIAHGLGLSKRVTFIGHVSEPETILPVFDIFAISSDTEQMPLTVLEAMAAGLPVVGVDVGDIRSMIAAANRGFVVPKEDEDAFSLKLAELLDAAELRARLSRLNREEAEARFPQEAMFGAYEALYQT